MRTLFLDGEWQLTATSPALNDAGVNAGDGFTMTIPGDVHSTLLEHGIIQDPYYGTNELDCLWVGKSDWSIERSFHYRKSSERCFLCLEKVDTIATLLINGKVAGEFDNEFHIHHMDVTDFMLDGENTIRFDFISAEKVAAERNERLPFPFPCDDAPNLSPHVNLVRKTQCNGGWDWGPTILVCGIYESVRLVSADSFLFEDFSVVTNPNKDGWRIRSELRIQSTETMTVFANASMRAENGTFKTAEKIRLEKGVHTYIMNMSVPNDCVKLWWPAGFGEQPLYDIDVEVMNQKIAHRIGFRTMEVKTEPTMGGRELTFSVNGQDIFSKGANWIPQDALPARITTERYESILRDVVKANMNMIRIWGGGWYEKKAFYDACDRYGILIWHDMMFACAAYPTVDWFMSSVERELRDQIRRIKIHPSIALYCGNNENLGALNWREITRNNYEKYYAEYVKFNDDLVGRVIIEEDPSRLFWPSSPCAGPGDRSDNWHSDGKGDMHFWSVWHDRKDFEEYHTIRPRFCSEFGYQSFPSLEEVKTFAPETQFDIFSPVMLHHQKNRSGNQIIFEHFSRLFRIPDSFEKKLYLSQVQQALAMQTGVTYWRSLMPYCMGTLYWQLNDVWPVTSWSSIEYSGRLKALHYCAKHFYEPTCPLLYTKDDHLYLYAVNDSAVSKAVDVALRLYDFSGNVVEARNFSATLSSNDSRLLDVIPLNIIDSRNTFARAFLHTEDERITEYTLLLTKPKDAMLKEPEISISTVKKLKSDVYEISLKSIKPAFFVMLASRTPGAFSDNLLTVMPDEATIVRFTPKRHEQGVEFYVNDLYSAIN